jgi:hypothetical protein
MNKTDLEILSTNLVAIEKALDGIMQSPLVASRSELRRTIGKFASELTASIEFDLIPEIRRAFPEFSDPRFDLKSDL